MAKYMSEVDDLVTKILRRYGWPRWRSKKEAMLRASYYVMNGKRKLLFFKCEKCGKDGLKSGDIHVHHIIHVIPQDGFDDIASWIKRLFCEPVGLAVLCTGCHKQIHEKDHAGWNKSGRKFSLKNK